MKTPLAKHFGDDLLKQAGFGSWALQSLLPGLGRTARGAAHLAKDVGLQNKAPGLYNFLRQTGATAAKVQRGSSSFVNNLPKGLRFPAKAVGFAAPVGMYMIPGVSNLVNPLISGAIRVGDVTGQVTASNSQEGRDMAARGGLSAAAGFYDRLSNSSYGDRRKLLNMLAQSTPAQQGPAPSMASATWQAVNPFSDGDLSSYINDMVRRKVMQ